MAAPISSTSRPSRWAQSSRAIAELLERPTALQQ
jgi:hypothetical protein